MRYAKNLKTENRILISEFFITKNMWEYFVIEPQNEDEPKNTDEIKFCYVLGIENEFGDVYMPEVNPYIISKTKNLKECLPPIGYEWED